MPEIYRPDIHALIEARARLATATELLEAVITERSHFDEERQDNAQVAFEAELVRVFDVCSTESTYDAVARQAAYCEIGAINEYNQEDAKIEPTSEPIAELLVTDESSFVDAAGVLQDRWERDDRNEHGDQVLEAIERLASRK